MDIKKVSALHKYYIKYKEELKKIMDELGIEPYYQSITNELLYLDYEWEATYFILIKVDMEIHLYKDDVKINTTNLYYIGSTKEYRIFLDFMFQSIIVLERAKQIVYTKEVKDYYELNKRFKNEYRTTVNNRRKARRLRKESSNTNGTTNAGMGLQENTNVGQNKPS